MADRRQVAAGSALTGAGFLAAARPDLPGAAINRVAVDRARGRLARLPDPMTASASHGRRLPNGTRQLSARDKAKVRWNTEHANLARKVTRPPVRGKVGAALRLGTGAAGVAGVWTGTGMVGRGLDHGRREVSKAAFAPEDFMWPTSQDLTGIPRNRAMPVDPLQMKASSSIMAGILAGASGRSLSRRQKKRIKRGAYAFVGAQHMVVAPTGMKGLVTA